MPFYREMLAVRRDPTRGVVEISTRKISLFQLFAGNMHVAHTPAPGAGDQPKPETKVTKPDKPDRLKRRSLQTSSDPCRCKRRRVRPQYCAAGTDTADCGTSPGSTHQTSSDPCQYDNDGECDVPAHCATGDYVDCGTSTGSTAHLTETQHCSDFSGSGQCGACTQHFEDWGLQGDWACSYCSTSGECTTSSVAVCTGNWIGDESCQRCHATSCGSNSQCPYTNDGECDEGRTGCPSGSDENDWLTPAIRRTRMSWSFRAICLDSTHRPQLRRCERRPLSYRQTHVGSRRPKHILVASTKFECYRALHQNFLAPAAVSHNLHISEQPPGGLPACETARANKQLKETLVDHPSALRADLGIAVPAIVPVAQVTGRQLDRDGC